MDSFKKHCALIRREIIEMAQWGKRGHIASAFSVVEMLTVLYEHIMKVDPKNPNWEDRDRFILSKGHGCMAQYALLANKGFFSKEHYQKFCRPDGLLGGHPEMKVPGVEAPTGSLGHGLAISVGFAIHAKLTKRKFRSFVVLGDGECNEGSIWEAALAASKHKLDNLIVLVDYNKLMSFGPTQEVCDMEPFAEKWRAFGFDTREVDMVNNPLGLKTFLENVPMVTGKPTAIICHTIKGFGVPFIENNLAWHHKSNISDEEVAQIINHLEQPYA